MRALVGLTAAAMVLLAAPVAVGQDEPSMAPVEDAVSLPGTTGRLDPGTYVDGSLGVDFRLTVPEGWIIRSEPIDGVGVDLSSPTFIPESPDSIAFVGFTRFDGEVFDGYCRPPGVEEPEFLEQRRTIEHSAQGLVDHLLADPYLETTEPLAIELGGHQGFQLDATAATTIDEACADVETHLWAIPVFGSWILIEGMASQYNILDVDGHVIVIALERGVEVDFETFEAAARPVLETMVLSTQS